MKNPYEVHKANNTYNMIHLKETSIKQNCTLNYLKFENLIEKI